MSELEEEVASNVGALVLRFRRMPPAAVATVANAERLLPRRVTRRTDARRRHGVAAVVVGGTDVKTRSARPE